MIKEEFVDGSSIIHRLDPRIKIPVAFFFSMVVAVSSSWGLLSLSIIFSAVAILMARINMGRLARRLMVVNGFILFLWLFLPFTYPGHTLFSLGPLQATREGIHYALLITIKSNVIILACIGLLATSSIFSLVHALSHLRVPDKLIQIFFFNYRYIHVLHREYQRMKNSMKARCFRPGTNLHTYRTFAYLVAMLLLKSYDRAERVYKAMLCRGFKGRYHVLDHFTLAPADVVIGGTMFMYIMGMAVCEWMLRCL
ncbi:MAG: cobalt ECF transporter T component CbiQ [bacterium]